MTEKTQDEDKALAPGIIKTQEDLAKALKTTTRTIRRYVNAGMPKTKLGYYDLAEIQKWCVEKNKGDTKLDKRSANEWEIEYQKTRTLIQDLKYKEAIGQLLPKEEVERGRVARILAIKRALLALPRAVAPQLIGLEPREIEAFLMERVRDVITRFAESGSEKKKTVKS